jgi:hypothetical protein
VSKVAAYRGGVVALEADKNCLYSGVTEVRFAKMTIDEAYVVSDAGALLYSRTDCYINLNITEVRATNARSNILTMQSFNSPMNLTGFGVDD